MAPHNLPRDVFDIEDALVTDANPALDDYSLDYERCARLHNYLVAYGWMVRHEWKRPDLDELANRPHRFCQEFEAIRDRLHPSLNFFLELIYEPTQAVFYWVENLAMQLFDEYILELYDENGLEDMERFVVIYGTVAELGSHCVGVIYDQELHRAAFPPTLENFDSVFPMEEHWEMWWPLETILTHWIQLIRMGKVIAHGDENQTPEKVRLSRSQIGPWSWHSYCPEQVNGTVAAIDRYTAAIEARMPRGSLLRLSRDAPLFTNADLDTAYIPNECFIRSVLTRTMTPRFNSIAPGLAVPHDTAAFIDRQKFTTIPRDNIGGEKIPPVLIFLHTDNSQAVTFNEEIRWLFLPFTRSEEIPFDNQDLIPAGLYSESVCRDEYDQEEGGFRLLLPGGLQSTHRDEEGARTSDGRLLTSGSFTVLFQHGIHHPFGGERRSQRLGRLINRWTELVESGVWRVGADGVDESIEKFQDADRGSWKDYWIEPSW
ncbi:hypothetical protein N7520_000506 [Penicillium odoratum]|uniref:uncharacterized protein n=1 Tax=Penicillium odoratum TaxID=1167516 RepID=UPI0025487484|nr:uncharacterized protein N7520_000506 [Penicillium odoratum]KAJ5777260.1 hypothetical protein N7520_000506 [Penicillium odoratum]